MTRATQADVAEMAGVSRQLVSLVVRDDPRVSPQRRSLVLAAMEQLGYRPNAAARTLATSRTDMIGVVVPGFQNPFYGELAEAMRARGESVGLDPLIVSVGEDPDREVQAVERFLELNVDALILVSPLMDEKRMEAYGEAVPTVLVTRNEGPASVDLIHHDDIQVGEMTTEHLLDRGYSPIVFLGPRRSVHGDSSQYRLHGYEAALARVGQDPITAIVGDDDDVERVVTEIASRFTSGFGIVAHDDRLAIPAAATLRLQDLRPGRDIGVTGVDNTHWAALPGVEITSVDQDLQGMTAMAFDLIAERIKGRTRAKEIVLPPTLVERSSSAPRA